MIDPLGLLARAAGAVLIACRLSTDCVRGRHDQDPWCIFKDSGAAAPPAASANPAPVDGTSHASPGAGPTFQLPMYNAKDLEAIAAEYIAAPVPDAFMWAHPEDARQAWAAHIAEIVVSALTYELQSRCYEANNPTERP